MEKEKYEKVERCKSINLVRMGETRINSFGSKMWIIEYNNINDITVQFEDGYVVKCRYYNFVKGSVKNPYEPRVFGRGFLGEGIYNSKENGHTSKRYNEWIHMMRRCYSSAFQIKNPSYKGVILCEEWHNFQNFAKWYDKNYYEIPELGHTEIDKDFLSDHKKIYGPETCVFVPQYINKLITKRKAKRGAYPIGVHYDKKSRKFVSQCSNGKNKMMIGGYGTPEEAFYVYKEYKEKLIKQIADKFKYKMPKNLYEAMYKYTVSIDD